MGVWLTSAPQAIRHILEIGLLNDGSLSYSSSLYAFNHISSADSLAGGREGSSCGITIYRILGNFSCIKLFSKSLITFVLYKEGKRSGRRREVSQSAIVY